MPTFKNYASLNAEVIFINFPQVAWEICYYSIPLTNVKQAYKF